ncbi:MAG: hypothetical protein ABGX82_08400 [Pseudomonas sp.]|uniref:hypothetical protein n=1 Tax=Pseudomonas sp. TaxID=306 RepID=UPI003242D445
MTKKRWDIPKREKTNTPPQAPENPAPTLGDLAGLVSKTVLVVNVLLAGSGYLFLAGYLAKVGINISELELDLPSLLFYGYTFTIKALGAASFLVLMAVVAIPMVIVMWLTYPWVQRALPRSDVKWQQWISIIVSAVLTLAILLVPGYILQYGGDQAIKGELGKMPFASTDGLKLQHTVITPTGKITGTQVIADLKHTYIRADNKVYKIASDTLQVVRIIEVTEPGSQYQTDSPSNVE